jgi:hypothetical protein
MLELRSRACWQARTPGGDKQLVDVGSQRAIDNAALLRPDVRKQDPMIGWQVTPPKLSKRPGSLQTAPVERWAIGCVWCVGHKARKVFQSLGRKRASPPRCTGCSGRRARGMDTDDQSAVRRHAPSVNDGSTPPRPWKSLRRSNGSSDLTRSAEICPADRSDL